MKSNIKILLEQMFAAPEPECKKVFLKKIQQPPISIFSFLLLQIFYIRKRVWLVSALITILTMISADYIGRGCIWVISAMTPFIALCVITENARSVTYGMAELEISSRFSLKSVIFARLSAIGLAHFIILCILVPWVGKNALLPGVRVSIYLLVPYLLTAVLGLLVARKIHEKEGMYRYMGISVMVSLLNVILKENIPGLYEEEQFIWWCITGIYLLVKVWSEYKKMLYQMEELVWNW